MKTYVAEINGEAILAFRALDDFNADAIVNDKDGGLRFGLTGFSGLLRADGSALWDEETKIEARHATDDEHKRWRKARDAEIGHAPDGKLIDRKMGDNDYALCVYLIPVKPKDEEELDGFPHTLWRRLCGGIGTGDGGASFDWLRLQNLTMSMDDPALGKSRLKMRRMIRDLRRT